MFAAILMFLSVAAVGAAPAIYDSRDSFNAALDVALDADPLLNKTVQEWDGIDAGYRIAVKRRKI